MAIELALAQPQVVTTSMAQAGFEELPPGRYAVSTISGFNGLSLPGGQQYGLLEVIKWASNSGVAYWYPRMGAARVFSCALTSNGWQGWAS